jgi:hypothetical protein
MKKPRPKPTRIKVPTNVRLPGSLPEPGVQNMLVALEKIELIKLPASEAMLVSVSKITVTISIILLLSHTIYFIPMVTLLLGCG